MKKLLFVLTLLFGVVFGPMTPAGSALGLVPEAQAYTERGYQFCKTPGNPQILAKLNADSLAKDPSGNTPLDPVTCKMKRPATPNELLQALQAADPEAGLRTAHDQTAYLNSLVEMEITGKWWSACRRPNRDGTGFVVILRCEARSLHKGEKAYGRPGHKPSLQGDCSNPMDQPDVPQDVCVYERIYFRAQDEWLKFKEHEKSDVSDGPCGPALRQHGSNVWEYPWEERCSITEWCDFSGADRVMASHGYKSDGRFGSVKLPGVDGYVEVRLPPDRAKEGSPYAINYCIGTGSTNAFCGMAIYWKGFTGNYAVLGFSQNQRPKGWKGTTLIWQDLEYCQAP